MSGFSFPPPPPPPPKPAQTTQGQFGHGYQYDSGFQSSRGRGNSRGSERVRDQPDGRGNNSSYATYLARGSSYRNADFSNVSSSSYGRQSQDQSLPYGALVTSNLPSQTHENSTGRHANSPSRTFAGHKRKLDALKPPNEKDRKPGPPTAPAIPSFGAPILPGKPQQSSRAPSTSKSTGKSLGLTPSNQETSVSYSDSEDGEADEESMYAELGDKLTFEHNGVVMSLKSQADLVAWKKERQKFWPTRARMVEKDEERRRIGKERKRLLGAASVSERARKPEIKPQANSHNDAASPGDPDERAKRLSELRKKVLESEAKNRDTKAPTDHIEAFVASSDVRNNPPDGQSGTMATSTEDLGIPQNDPGAREGIERAVLEDGPAGTLPDATSQSDLEDDKPEVVSSKAPDAQTPSEKKAVCKYFAASGCCRFGDSCHFRHEQPTRTGNTRAQPQQEQQAPRQPTQPRQQQAQNSAGRKGILQRFKEQEEEEENRLALQVIKYLGKMGLFNDTHAETEVGEAPIL